jgi:hypothetical protein
MLLRFLTSLLLICSITFSVSAQDSANLASFKEKMDKYTEDGLKAYENKDYYVACNYLSMASNYAKELGIKEKNPEIVRYGNTACMQSQKKDSDESIKKIKDAIEPYKNDCQRLKAAKNICSISGNYDGCMKIRFGSRYQYLDDAICVYVR